jgi:hypothetical protein
MVFPSQRWSSPIFIAWPSDLATIVTFIACAAVYTPSVRDLRQQPGSWAARARLCFPGDLSAVGATLLVLWMVAAATIAVVILGISTDTNPPLTCLVFVPLVVPGIYLIAPDGFGLRDGPGKLGQH